MGGAPLPARVPSSSARARALADPDVQLLGNGGSGGIKKKKKGGGGGGV